MNGVRWGGVGCHVMVGLGPISLDSLLGDQLVCICIPPPITHINWHGSPAERLPLSNFGLSLISI